MNLWNSKVEGDKVYEMIDYKIEPLKTDILELQTK